MASHLPVNHPLRPLYRLLAALGAILAIVIGGLGAVATKDAPLFDQGAHYVLFDLFRVNLGHSLIMLVSGVILLLATFVGRNVDRMIYLWLGAGLMVVSMASLPLMRTDVNILNFGMPNVALAMILGTVLFTAGLYGKSGRAASH